ncbi:hypothetical protein [Phormidesmis priestleyi]
MNKMLWMAGLGVAIALGSCGSNDQAQTPKSPTPVAQAPQSFPKPIVSTTAPMPTIAVKGMIQSTNAQARLSQISTANRRDPFAALLPTNIKVATINTPQSTVTRSAPTQAQKLQPVKPTQAPQILLTPLTPNSLPVLPSLPVNSAPLTPNTLPILPSVSRTSLADAIEITGVIQVGGKVTAIVQSPTESTARYVRPGEYLANGSVLLKRIIMSKTGEPTIVLQQNGVEVTKSIGSTRVASTL